MTPELSVVVVSYNAREPLRRCLAALPAACAGVSWEAVVVDNASTDGSPEAVPPGVRLLANRENVGYGRACNQGARAAGGALLCFLNADTVPAPEALTRLARRILAHSDAGAVGPALTGPDGARRNSAFRFPGWTRPLLNFPIVDRLTGGMFSLGYPRGGGTFSRGGPVDWLSGACLVLRRKSFEDAGGFDERYFLYFEDTDLCRRLRAKGWSVLYHPAAEVLHEGGASGGGERLVRELNRSRLIYYATHHPGPRHLWERLLTAFSLFRRRSPFPLPLAALILLGWLAHGAFTAKRPMVILGMDAFYQTLIDRFAAGEGFTFDGRRPDAHAGPAFVAAAGLFRRAGGSWDAFKWLQFSFDLAAALFTALAARAAYGNGAGLAASLLMAWYPGWWNHDARVRIENLFTALCALSTWLLVLSLRRENPGAPRRGLPPALAGLSAGTAALAKAVAAPALLLAAPLLFRRAGPRAAGLFVLGWIAVVSPWWVRNAAVLGRFPLFQGGGWASLALSADKDFRWGVPFPLAREAAWKARIGHEGLDDLQSARSDERFKAASLAALRRNPGGYMAGLPARFLTFWIGNKHYLLGEFHDDVSRRGAAIAWAGLFKRLLLVPALLVLAALTVLRRRREGETWALLVFPASLCLVYSLTNVESGRYQLPILPSIFILVSGFFSSPFPRTSESRLI